MKKMIELQQIITCLFFTCLILFTVGCNKDENPEYSLKVNIMPVGSGTVDLSPSSDTYPEGIEVTLSPNPSSNYRFTAWSGTDSSYVHNNKIIMSKNMDVIANFSLNSYSIAASVNPENSGTITGAGTYDYAQAVSLTATPTEGYTFTNWTENGTQVSTDVTYSFTANGDRTLVANFSLNSYSITASVNPENSGTITGAGTYDYGQAVSLTATPIEGYTFTNWTENGTQVSTDATYSFTANGDRTLVANFEMKTMIRLQSGSGLNSGARIYFVALSKNVNYFDLTSDELFDYNKTDADWYIDGDVIPFVTDYKDFELTLGEYYFLVSGSGTVMVTTVTVNSGKQTFKIYGTNFGGLSIDIVMNSANKSLIEEKTRKIINYNR
jgi:uncharacterized repeat protein (TIGR02543 family)